MFPNISVCCHFNVQNKQQQRISKIYWRTSIKPHLQPTSPDPTQPRYHITVNRRVCMCSCVLARVCACVYINITDHTRSVRDDSAVSGHRTTSISSKFGALLRLVNASGHNNAGRTRKRVPRQTSITRSRSEFHSCGSFFVGDGDGDGDGEVN